jgi:hypothetical protein
MLHGHERDGGTSGTFVELLHQPHANRAVQIPK